VVSEDGGDLRIGDVADERDRPWFSATMSTGALAVVLGSTPNRFPGLQTIGKILFIFDISLFLLFTGLMITRFCLVPRKLTASLHHPVEGLFHGTYWVSVALILNCAYVYGHTEVGSWLTKAHEVCFWIYCAIAFTVSIAQYSMFFRLERLNVTDAVPAWIFPIYPLLVVGPLAGTILPSQPEDASWKIFIGGILFKGLAWLISFLMYGIYMQRLMTSELPSATVRPGMYVSVGPAGTMCCGSLQSNALIVCRVYCSRTFYARQTSSATHSQ
jgi:C4-dicarboxylate transporter/malic acid transport protein